MLNKLAPGDLAGNVIDYGDKVVAELLVCR